MGLLGDFAVGAAQAGERVGMAQIQSDIEEKKRMRLAEFQEQLNIKSESRREESDVRREGRQEAGDTRRRGLVNAEALTQRQAQFDQDNNPDNVQTSIDTATSKARNAGDIGREQRTADLTNESAPGNLAATRNIARAKDIDHGAGLRNIQIQTAQLGLEEKRQVNKLMDEAETTKDPARRAAIIQSLTVRGIIKPGESDTEKVTTETMNPDGSTSKTERTQKRQAGATASPGGSGGHPEGTRLTGRDGKAYIVQDGVPVLATGAASNTGSSESGGRKGFLKKLTDGPEKEYTATVGKDGKITYQKNPRYVGSDIAPPQAGGQWRNIALPSDLSSSK